MLIKDPRQIPQSAMPLIVLWNNTDDEMSWGIDERTDIPGDHPCSHAMTAIFQGKFASQGLTYGTVPMDKYMIAGGWLAFVQLTNCNPAFITAYTNAVLAHLALPWWEKFYNFPEIVGQFFGDPSFSFPGLFDCSMIDVSLLQSCAQFLPAQDQTIINGMSKYLNPEQLLDIVTKNPSTFNIYGTWDSQSGIIA